MISIKHLINDKGNQINNCVVVYNVGVTFLFSYESLIASVDSDGTVKRYTDFVSNTTSRHIKAFFKEVNVDMTVKQFYNDVPIEK